MTKKKLLWHQGLYVQAPDLFPNIRNFMLVGGYGCGKTSGNAAAAEKLITGLQGARDVEGHKPRILLGGITISHLEKTTLGYIKQDLLNSKTDFSWDSKNNILRVGDVDLFVTPMQSPKEITGVDCYAAILDELDDLGLAAAEDTTYEAMKAVNERVRQRIRGVRSSYIQMGSTSQGQKGLYRIYTQFKKTGTGFVRIRGRTADNPHLDPAYVDALYKFYTEREQKVYLEGEFLAISQGQVFGDFDWEKNFLRKPMDREIAPDETVFWGQDFNQGYHRGCVGVVRNGVIYIVKRYEFPDIREAPRVVRYDFPKNRILWIPDTTAKEQITHFTKELRRYDIRIVMRSRNPLVEDSAFLVNKLLYTKRLIITEAAEETAEALATAQRDDQGRIPKGVGPRSPIHDCDSARLLCFFVACNRKEMADIRRLALDRHLDLLEENKEPTVEELGYGYYEAR